MLRPTGKPCAPVPNDHVGVELCNASEDNEKAIGADFPLTYRPLLHHLLPILGGLAFSFPSSSFGKKYLLRLLPGLLPLFVTRKRLVMFPKEKCLPASAGILFATTFTWWCEV
jgi:hypothetical protein